MKELITSVLIFSCTLTYGQPIANCNNPSGYSYNHYHGLVSKTNSGFDNDKISGGVTTIQKLRDGSYDILFIDAKKIIVSAVQDGGKVVLLRKGEKDATFLHYFPNRVIEIYTIWIDSEGNSKFDMLQSKGGDEMPIHKSSVMIGKCDSINFKLLSN